MTTPAKLSFNGIAIRLLATFLVTLVAGGACLVPSDEEETPFDCSRPHAGCPCPTDGAEIECSEQVGESSLGQVVCGNGRAVCVSGTWSLCEISDTVTLKPNSQLATLGLPVSCPNPCDKNCFSFNDDPQGEEKNGVGIVEGKTGLTLPGALEGVPNNCKGGKSGTCAHTICEAGGPLAAECDAVTTPVPAVPVTEVVFSEDFKNNSKGWTLGPEWAIGPAKSSSGHAYGNADPANDTTPTADKGVAGVVIGGNASIALPLHDYYWLTSPAINTQKYNQNVTLSFKRWLNSDYPPYMNDRIEVFNGAAWIAIWNGFPTDPSWQTLTYDVTSYANANFRVRFGFNITSSGVSKVSSWNLDDVQVNGTYLKADNVATGGSCVTQVCKVSPTCCTTAWTWDCAAKVKSVCNVTCACITAGEFVGCYKDAFDHDGDSYTGLDGDCADCDPTINAGAYDFANNGIDDDCNGTQDDEPAKCDKNLPLSSLDPIEHARAIDLCRTGVANATGAKKTWGVLPDSHLAQADAVKQPAVNSYGLTAQFGTNNAPINGARMAAYSSGTARAPGDPNYINPNGGGYNHGTTCKYPPGFPKNKVGCQNAFGGANDSSGLWLKIRTPTNAKSFSYNFNFFAAEYPEWVCTSYNDHYVALLGSTGFNGNISFDANNNPVSVNVAFFTVPGCPTCTHKVLTNTGFDGKCDGQTCGGSTNWLQTQAPIKSGETITMHFSTWDAGDHAWDATVLVDNWIWSPQDATVKTIVLPPPPVIKYSPGTFVRDYDATGMCPAGTTLRWSNWSWTTATPSTSQITFTVQAAASKAGLGVAPKDAINFTNPPGPVILAGTPVVAKVGTTKGAANVDTTLKDKGRDRASLFLRVTSNLTPSVDLLAAPTLLGWNMQFNCLDDD